MALPEFVIFRLVAPCDDGVPPLFPRHGWRPVPVVLRLHRYGIQRPWLGSCLAEATSAGDAASDCLGSDAVTRFAVLFGQRSAIGNHRVVTRSSGVDGL